jgi:DNA-binding MarR family transcriptional regulator
MARLRREGPESDDFLPLPRDTFDVLVSLADRDRHGYAILQDIAERTDGRIRLSPSTLYAVIKRLLESELIVELSERPDPAHDDERRRYYRLTPLVGAWPNLKPPGSHVSSRMRGPADSSRGDDSDARHTW